MSVSMCTLAGLRTDVLRISKLKCRVSLNKIGLR